MKIAVIPDGAMMIIHLVTKNGHEYLSSTNLSSLPIEIGSPLKPLYICLRTGFPVDIHDHRLPEVLMTDLLSYMLLQYFLLLPHERNQEY